MGLVVGFSLELWWLGRCGWFSMGVARFSSADFGFREVEDYGFVILFGFFFFPDCW